MGICILLDGKNLFIDKLLFWKECALHAQTQNPLPAITFSSASIRQIIGLYLVSRLVLLLLAGFAPYLNDLTSGTPNWEKSFFEIIGYNLRNFTQSLCVSDCPHYIDISKNGYDTFPSRALHSNFLLSDLMPPYILIVYANWAFFPLLPLLIASLHSLTGLDHLTVTFLISQTAAFAGFFLFYAYVQQGWNKQMADKMLFYYAFWPIGIYLSVPMTEALFVPLLLGIFLSAQRKAWFTVAFLVALFSSLRVVGVLIVFPLILIAARQYGWKNLLFLRAGTEKALLALAATGLGLAIYMIYLHHLMGDALAFSHIQAAWWRQIEWPWVWVFAAINPFKLLEEGSANIFIQLHIAVAFWSFIISLRLFRAGKAPEWLYFTLCLLVGLANDNVISLIRFISVHVYLIVPLLQTSITHQKKSTQSDISKPYSVTSLGFRTAFLNITYVFTYISWSLCYLSGLFFAT